MKLSIVTTLFHSEEYIYEFHSRMSIAAKTLVGEDYEIIYVDDGSPDDSASKVSSIGESDHHVVLIELARNFGHHKAMIAGLDYSRGEKIYLIDVDLEELPEWLLDFDAYMVNERIDVVYGLQKKRKGGWFEKISGRIYFSLLNSFLDEKFPENVVTARLMTREFLDAMLVHKERDFVIGGLTLLTGFKQSGFEIVKKSSSPTTYSLSKKWNLFLNTLTSLTSLPLVAAFYFGLFITAASFLSIIVIIFKYYVYGSSVVGWHSLMAMVLLIGGVNIFAAGILGIYISKIFIEVKNRPNYIIKNERKAK